LNRTRSRAEGRTFLKYSELPSGTRFLTVSVLMMRETPKLNSPCVIDIAPDVDCDGAAVKVESSSIAINLTNLKALAAAVGDDVSIIMGGKMTFGFSWKENPNPRAGEDQEVMGFDFIRAELPPHLAAAQGNGAAPAADAPAAKKIAAKNAK
jgi:hypothetical protein